LGSITPWDLIFVLAYKENQRENCEGMELLEKIRRETSICGRDDQKPSVMAVPPHKGWTASIVGHFTGSHPDEKACRLSARRVASIERLNESFKVPIMIRATFATKIHTPWWIGPRQKNSKSKCSNNRPSRFRGNQRPLEHFTLIRSVLDRNLI
jgi:hypothetical protein